MPFDQKFGFPVIQDPMILNPIEEEGLSYRVL